MARTRSSSGGRGAVRTLALVAAVLIALGSTAAVVLSDDPETLRLAVVGALWAFVLAASAPRREPEPVEGAGAALELRRTYEIELEKEVAARREYELQLEVYLRRELERGLTEDVAALRDEVGRMRGELIDRLDGELRMERIETTRLIGGSLQALREEARRLGIGLPVPPQLTPPAPAPAPPGAGSPGSPSGFGPAGSGEYGSPGGPDQYGTSSRPGGGAPAGGYPAGTDYSAPSAFPTPSIFDEPARPASSPPFDFDAGPPAYRPYPPFPGPGPDPAPAGRPAPPAPSPAPPPAPRAPAAGESRPPRRRRAREDDEDNEVMSRLLGR